MKENGIDQRADFQTRFLVTIKLNPTSCPRPLLLQMLESLYSHWVLLPKTNWSSEEVVDLDERE